MCAIKPVLYIGISIVWPDSLSKFDRCCSRTTLATSTSCHLFQHAYDLSPTMVGSTEGPGHEAKPRKTPDQMSTKAGPQIASCDTLKLVVDLIS